MKTIDAELDGSLGREFELTRPGQASSEIGRNWQELSAESHYRTAVEIQRALLQSDFDEAQAGIEELIKALGRSEKRALKSQLVRLMAHIIKWKTQPERRSFGWIASIYNSRDEIADIQTETPSVTDDVIRQMWDKCLRAAILEAEGEMNQKAPVSALSWNDVFDKEYEIE